MRSRAVTDVRAATPDDAEVIAAINARSWRHAYQGIIPDSYLAGLDQAAIARSMRDVIVSGGTVVVAGGEEVRGFSWMAASRDEDAVAGTAEIIAIYVDPTHARRGIGRALVAATCEAARVRAFDRITLWVLDQNAAGRAFYEALGFTADGGTKTTDRWGGGPIGEVRYRRPTTSIHEER